LLQFPIEDSNQLKASVSKKKSLSYFNCLSSLLVDLRLDLEAARNEGGGGDGGEGGDGGIATSSCLFWLEKIQNIKMSL
jgi:hypothetical protein